MKSLNKKGQVMQNLGALGVGVAVLVVIMAVMFLMMAQVQTNTIDLGEACDNTTHLYNVTINTCCNTTTSISRHCFLGNLTPLSTVMNSTQDLTTAAATIPGWVPLIILVSIGGIVLFLVSRFKR